MIDDPQSSGSVPGAKPTAGPAPNTNKPKKTRRHLWPQQWSTRKKRLCTGLLIACLLLVIGGGAAWYRASHQSKKVVEVQKTAEPPKPTTEASRLTGVQIEPSLNGRAVTGVMIENSPDARPQSGLLTAGTVFEAVAEGGITRFLALYLESQPDYIGPVRSSRPYYLDWLLPFEAAYAHAGGSPDALAQIKQLGVRDMDQFANPGAYERVSQRYAPHNLYTSMAKLDALRQQKGFTTSTFTSWPRKAEAPANPPTVTSIDFKVSSYLYNPHYDYDPATNNYKRSEGGKPHTDERTGAQLNPKVVIALIMSSGIASDGTHTNYGTTGSGPMFVFQDGGVTTGTWQKADRKAPFVFTGADGQPLKLNPGQTWLTMVPAGGVTYK